MIARSGKDCSELSICGLFSEAHTLGDLCFGDIQSGQFGTVGIKSFLKETLLVLGRIITLVRLHLRAKPAILAPASTTEGSCLLLHRKH